ncbi:hypothetical protein BDV98DRAFT_569383, partial [Pterulicium gracile]
MLLVYELEGGAKEVGKEREVGKEKEIEAESAGLKGKGKKKKAGENEDEEEDGATGEKKAMERAVKRARIDGARMREKDAYTLEPIEIEFIPEFVTMVGANRRVNLGFYLNKILRYFRNHATTLKHGTMVDRSSKEAKTIPVIDAKKMEKELDLQEEGYVGTSGEWEEAVDNLM